MTFKHKNGKLILISSKLCKLFLIKHLYELNRQQNTKKEANQKAQADRSIG
jgi:hypothetical protein